MALVALCDSGLEWCGFKMFLAIPENYKEQAAEILRCFNADIKTRNVTLDDFNRLSVEIRKKILLGKQIVN